MLICKFIPLLQEKDLDEKQSAKCLPMDAQCLDDIDDLVVLNNLNEPGKVKVKFIYFAIL